MGKKDSSASASLSNDARFAAMASAPMFKKAQHKNQKVKVDDRFKKVLTDERFRANVGKVDKYGRKQSQHSNKTEAIKELQEFYDIDDDVDGDKEEEEEEEEEQESSNNAANEGLNRLDYLTKLSRGELDVHSDSESDGNADSESDEDVRQSALAVNKGEEVEERDVTSNRLAVQNCDWESVTAQDLMVILQSFCPGGKAVRSVSIYPSDFGLKAMAEEAKYGPQHIWKTQKKSEEETSENEEEEDESEEEEGEESSLDEEEDEEDQDEEDPEEGSDSEESKTESELAREQQENDEALEDIYNELKGEKKKQLSVKQFEKWEDVQNLLSEKIVSLEDLHSMIRDVLMDSRGEEQEEEEVEVSGSTKLSLDQFKAVVAMLDEAEVELGAAADLEEQEEEDNEDLYDGIEQLSGDEEQEEEDEEEQEEGSEEEEGSERQNKNKRNKRGSSKGGDKASGGDFKRREGAVGLVMHDDLLERGKTRPEKGKKKGGENDYDEVALRRYELSKLRYYFAVVECDDPDTASVLYQQLDSIELENSSMVFDMRLIPDDVSFETRTPKEVCRAVPQSYKPPEFVINALQHTKVTCSWDEGEKSRERKLTNISSWRNLNQSELQQYIASSDSESDEEEEQEEDRSSSKNKKKNTKKGSKAGRLRALLLGGGGAAGGSDSEEQQHLENESEDDFFGPGRADGDEEQEEEGEKWMSFMPEEDRESNNNKKKSKCKGGDEESETPYEALKRREAEKRKQRKAARQNGGNNTTEDDEEEEQEQKKPAQKIVKSKYVGKNGLLIAASEEESKEEKQKRQAQLQLMFSEGNDDSEGDSGDERAALSRDRLTHDLRQLAKEEKRRAKKMKKKNGKRSQAEEEEGEEPQEDVKGLRGAGKKAAAEEFKVDLQDDRFKSLFDGNAKFGIDMTSTEYKETAGVKQILSEQRKRRQTAAPSSSSDSPKSSKKSRTAEPTVEASTTATASDLANKLKKKFGGK